MSSLLPATIVFDFDGTLYEEPAVYTHYAEELCRYVPVASQAVFRAEWHAASEGRHALCVGCGYDTHTQTLFRHAGGKIISRCDWQGHPLPAKPNQGAPDKAENAQPGALPMETLVFGDDVLNIGDLWSLTGALGRHHGLTQTERSAAFLATRAFMDGPEFPMSPTPGLGEVLERLQRREVRLVAMTNSPIATTRAVLGRLGLFSYFDEVIADARKPRGMRQFLAMHPAPTRMLSVGDNYVNEIEPMLQAGGAGLYIDRFATGQGDGQARCSSVESIPALVTWLDTRLAGLTEETAAQS